MSERETGSALWAPEACTLPTAQQPLRVAEFDDLFAQALREVHRPDATSLRLALGGGQATEARVRDLTTRESACCAFFDFRVTRRDTDVVLEVRVPPAHVDVLEALAVRAAAARAS
jgi:hypothetical protein